jgi:hypothetical protein
MRTSCVIRVNGRHDRTRPAMASEQVGLIWPAWLGLGEGLGAWRPRVEISRRELVSTGTTHNNARHRAQPSPGGHQIRCDCSKVVHSARSRARVDGHNIPWTTSDCCPGGVITGWLGRLGGWMDHGCVWPGVPLHTCMCGDCMVKDALNSADEGSDRTPFVDPPTFHIEAAYTR